MDERLDAICKKLDETAAKFLSIGSPGRTLKETNGWQFPALSREDFAGMATRLANQLRAANVSEIDTSDAALLADFPRRLELLWTDTMPQMFGGQPHAVYAYTESIHALERVLSPFIAMAEAEEVQYLPPKIITRIKAATRRIDRIEGGQDGLEEKVNGINKAYSAAERLPTTLQELDDARAELEEVRARINKLYEEAAKTQGKIETNASKSDEQLGLMNQSASIAADLVKRCENAYQVATTKGLAGAFDQRASRLNLSIIFWVIGLLIALYFGAKFGAKRIDALSTLTSKGNPEWGIILMHVILSILSVGGPLWFAWLATKQIGQRFRLAEDYAFKASVAKAYEGYRKQAENLDESFATRLFSSALTRLDEAPLRLVEPDTHGSPWNEMLKSETVKRAAAMGPRFQEEVLDLARRTLDTTKSAVSARSKATDNADASVAKGPE